MIDEYLSDEESLGPDEPPSPGSEFQRHDAADVDTKFLLALIRESHAISRLVCVPRFRMCVDKEGDVTFLYRSCETMRLRAGVIVTHAATRPVVHVPPRLADIVRGCKKPFVFLNFGMYSSGPLQYGHANALLLDKRNRVVERFEPNGLKNAQTSLDNTLAKTFEAILPGWTYEGTRVMRTLRGPQAIADAYGGMCVTYSLMYVLARLTQPHLSTAQVSESLVKGKSERQMRSDVLRLNRFVSDKLRKYKRGSLRGARKGRRRLR